MDWPRTRDELIRLQAELAALTPKLWSPGPMPVATGGCFVCFERGGPSPGRAGDRGWSGAALGVAGGEMVIAVVEGRAGAAYEAGLLALREGPLLEAAVRGLPRLPDVLLVDATGRDHPRRAGLALHLGAVLGVPTVGVTHRPLLASGEWPDSEPGARAPLHLAGELVGYWVRVNANVRPLVVHAGWRTDPNTAVAIMLAALGQARTPVTLAEARRAAREARARATGESEETAGS